MTSKTWLVLFTVFFMSFLLGMAIANIIDNSHKRWPGAGQLGSELIFPEGWKPILTPNGYYFVCEKDGTFRYCTPE